MLASTLLPYKSHYPLDKASSHFQYSHYSYKRHDSKKHLKNVWHPQRMTPCNKIQEGHLLFSFLNGPQLKWCSS